jgi:hypothetical protein
MAIAVGGAEFPLQEGDCPGKSGQFQLQVACTLANQGSTTVAYDFFVVCVEDAVMQISNGQVTISNGVVSTSDALDAVTKYHASASDVKSIFGGYKEKLSKYIHKRGSGMSGGGESGGAIVYASGKGLSGGAHLSMRQLKARLA